MTKTLLIKTKTGHRLFYVWFLISTVISMIWLSNVAAVTTISQGFSTTDKNLAIGSIVSMEKNSIDSVVAATNNNADSIIGVVINDGSSLITFSDGKSSQVQVATNGYQPVLVSDINGEVYQGDPITASPIKGVGMKATSNSKIVGTAQGSLADSVGNSKQEYTDSDGNKQTITLGQVNVQVNVSIYNKQPEKTIIPQALQNLANRMAGKNVSTLPIIISAAIFIITLIIVCVIIYSMIRSSIISVGRNPMSQSAVYRDVIQLSVLVLVILGVALISIYTILTRF